MSYKQLVVTKINVGKSLLEMSKITTFKLLSPKVSKFTYNAGQFFTHSDNTQYVNNIDNKHKVWESFLKIYPSLCTANDLAKIFLIIAYFYKYDIKSKSLRIEVDNPQNQLNEIEESTKEVTNIIVPNEMKEKVAGMMEKIKTAIKKTKKDKMKTAIQNVIEYLETGVEGEYDKISISSPEAMKKREIALLELLPSAKDKISKSTAQNSDISEESKDNISIHQLPPKRVRPQVVAQAGRRTPTKRHKANMPRPAGAPAPLEVPKETDKQQ